MILYTMMPKDLIFPPDEGDFGKQVEIVHDGIPVVAEKVQDTGYRIVRVLSTDPAHYLDPKYFPGAIISK